MDSADFAPRAVAKPTEMPSTVVIFVTAAAHRGRELSAVADLLLAIALAIGAFSPQDGRNLFVGCGYDYE